VRLQLIAAAAAAALPVHGAIVPARSLGGLRLGETPAQVRTVWGTGFGRCRGCARPTWYYNYARFLPQGAAVEFEAHRVAALYTVWKPSGWRTPEGLRLGDPVARVTSVYGPLKRRDCGAYYALLLRRGDAVTEFYVFGNQLWGFGLSRASIPACRS
jgi:hypothetical protein